MFDLFEEGIIIARVFVHVFFCAFALALLFCNADDVIYRTKLFSTLRVLLVYILSFLSFLSLSLSSSLLLRRRRWWWRRLFINVAVFFAVQNVRFAA